jgi:hypothetical protein
MERNDEPRGCACGSRYSDIMRAPPPKKDWLRKTTCPRCGKVYWTNKETDYCMDCEPLVAASPPKSGSI